MSGHEIPAGQQTMSGQNDHFSGKVSQLAGHFDWFKWMAFKLIKLITGTINVVVLKNSVIYENS